MAIQIGHFANIDVYSFHKKYIYDTLYFKISMKYRLSMCKHYIGQYVDV